MNRVCIYDFCEECGVKKEEDGRRYKLCKRCMYVLRKKKWDDLREKTRNIKWWDRCIVCGKEKNTRTEQFNSKCGHCGQLGIKASAETRVLWSKQRRGRKLSKETKKKISESNKGQKRSIESRTRMSNSKTGLNRTVEEYEEYLETVEKEGRRQKQGKTYESKEWSRAVRTRDGWTCRACGAKKGLHAHHIKPWAKYPEKRFDINNGISLCQSCHNKYRRIEEKKVLDEILPIC